MKLAPILLTLSLLLCQSAHARTLEGAVQFSPGKGRIGVQVTESGKVSKVHPQSPAERAGIVPGDQILSVDGVPGDVGHIHGTPGSTVSLIILHGSQQFTRDVERIDEHLIRPYNVHRGCL